MQRLEAEATMNEVMINPGLDEILQRELDQHKFTAWRDGKTGWPFFDACGVLTAGVDKFPYAGDATIGSFVHIVVAVAGDRQSSC